MLSGAAVPSLAGLPRPLYTDPGVFGKGGPRLPVACVAGSPSNFAKILAGQERKVAKTKRTGLSLSQKEEDEKEGSRERQHEEQGKEAKRKVPISITILKCLFSFINLLLFLSEVVIRPYRQKAHEVCVCVCVCSHRSG
jgi:hypothetical protein